jgi:large subunit ribosomal protein L18
MGTLNLRTQARLKRKKRIRKKLVGTTSRPRLCVFRSAKHIYAQLVDDSLGQTLVAASSMEKAVREVPETKNKITAANTVGKIIGQGKSLANALWKRASSRSYLTVTDFCITAG